jgi:hypothetical protein
VSQFVNPLNPADVVYEHQMFLRGHFAYVTPTPTTISNVGVGVGYYLARYNAPVTDLGKFDGFQLASTPLFHGAALDPNVTQLCEPRFGRNRIRLAASEWRHRS